MDLAKPGLRTRQILHLTMHMGNRHSRSLSGGSRQADVAMTDIAAGPDGSAPERADSRSCPETRNTICERPAFRLSSAIPAELVLVERDRPSPQVVHPPDQTDGAGVKHLLQDRALLADLFHGFMNVLLAHLVDVGVVL